MAGGIGRDARPRRSAGRAAARLPKDSSASRLGAAPGAFASSKGLAALPLASRPRHRRKRALRRTPCPGLPRRLAARIPARLLRDHGPSPAHQCKAAPKGRHVLGELRRSSSLILLRQPRLAPAVEADAGAGAVQARRLGQCLGEVQRQGFNAHLIEQGVELPGDVGGWAAAVMSGSFGCGCGEAIATSSKGARLPESLWRHRSRRPLRPRC